MSFVQFMAGPVGRGVRVVAGVVLSVLGISLGGAGGWILALIGLVVFLAGAMNFCLFAPLFKGPFWGKDVA